MRDCTRHEGRSLDIGIAALATVWSNPKRDLCSYLSRCWPREKYLRELPVGGSELRVALHRLACVNDGKELGWRRIYDILSSDPMAIGR